ncbi:Hypothetical predicted protein [Mytilus galloprovincialis]|uniref:Uncharacterized protein n=1 Tax=Mytilus galloprovincialis TaxID=29158 RepID=A0A8B6BU75_MYTGA|nr:Hypothetical predicted protein [Mytilus galloprovincialis]
MNTELGESTIVELALNGLLPHLKASVTQRDPKTYNELRQAIDIAINVTECHNHSVPRVPVTTTTENPATASRSTDIISLLSSFIDSMKTVVRQEVMALTPNRDNREERQFSQVPCRGCGALSYATVFSWILLVGVYAVNADGEVQMHRINYGVTFAKEANIVFGSENWLHTFEIPLPPKISSVQFPRCDIVHQNCHILNQVISQLSAVRTGVTANINNTISIPRYTLFKMEIVGLSRKLLRAFLFNMDDSNGKEAVKSLVEKIITLSQLNLLEVIQTGSSSHMTCFATSSIFKNLLKDSSSSCLSSTESSEEDSTPERTQRDVIPVTQQTPVTRRASKKTNISQEEITSSDSFEPKRHFST